MKRIMILGASILQLPAIKKAIEMGLYVLAVDIDPKAIGFAFAHESLLISTTDTEKILMAASAKKIDGILTLATDLPMRSVAAVAQKLNLVGISIDTALCATDKFKMRERLSLLNVPIPSYYRTNTIEEYYNIIKYFDAAFIVKPADNSGSRGINLVRSEDEIEQAYYHAKNYSRNGEVLIEEYMTGREVSVETLSIKNQVHVLAITDKLTTGAPHFVEMGHSQPAQFSSIITEKIKKVATEAVLALGIENGPSHTEIIVTETGPKIVEIGARLGGDCITTHLVPLSTGIDMVECCIKIALKEEPDFDVKFNRASAIRYFNTHSGKIQSIKGIEEASLIDGVHEITLVKKVDEIINDIHCSTDRVGYIIASGKKVEDAISSCEEALKTINICIV
jgi:biotin carboxylase